MATEILMPKVDMVMETGTFVEWLKKEGETVQKGDPLFVIMTDKAAIECEATATGTLAGLTAKVDDIIPINGRMGYILKAGESLPVGDAPAAPAPVAAAPVAAPASAAIAVAPAQPEIKINTEDVRATPLARKMARELGIDLRTVTGRGPRGRIYQADVEAFQKQVPAVQPAVPQPAAVQTAFVPAAALPATEVPLPNARLRERIKLKGPRAVIAQRLAYSSSTIPHIYETISVDMTEATRLRERILPTLQEQTGLKVSFTVILAYAIARLLPRHPYLNSSFAGDEVLQWEDVHIGIATNLEDYLIVPVIREAQNRDLKSIMVELASLLEKARAKKLEPADMSGSTFTISNLGMYGIEEFTAIINPPESAILAVGKITDTPVVIDGQMVVRPMMKLTLGADHRVNDGARVARFLGELKAALENPYLLL